MKILILIGLCSLLLLSACSFDRRTELKEQLADDYCESINKTRYTGTEWFQSGPSVVMGKTFFYCQHLTSGVESTRTSPGKPQGYEYIRYYFTEEELEQIKDV